MADTNGFIAHALTMDADSQTPVYSADDYRHAVAALLAATDGTAFGGLQGVRMGAPSPLMEVDGTTVTVHPHAGWLCPWGQPYSYALTKDATVTVDNTSGSFKIAVVLNDKAAGHGDGESVSLQAYAGNTGDSTIPGLVLGTIDAGVASDTAIRLGSDYVAGAASVDQLSKFAAPDGMRARLDDGTEYVRQNGVWVSKTPTLTVLTPTSTDTVAYSAQLIGADSASPLLAVQITWTNKGAFNSVAWGGVDLLKMKEWTTSNGEVFGWLQDNNANGETRYTSTYYAAKSTISWRDSAAHPISAGCWHNGGIIIPVKPL